jgi:hypothetical protein
MQSIIYGATEYGLNGGIDADIHYRETGHKINHFGKITICDIDARNKFADFIETYKCSQCNFVSSGGERRMILEMKSKFPGRENERG